MLPTSVARHHPATATSRRRSELPRDQLRHTWGWVKRTFPDRADPLGVEYSVDSPTPLEYSVFVRPRHPKKDVERVLRQAERLGFEVVHPWVHWGALRCPGDCQLIAAFGTPANSHNHAQALGRAIGRCPHIEEEGP